MKKYLVSVQMTAVVDYEVEADSPEEAWAEAYEMADIMDGSFEFREDFIEEITDS